MHTTKQIKFQFNFNRLTFCWKFPFADIEHHFGWEEFNHRIPIADWFDNIFFEIVSRCLEAAVTATLIYPNFLHFDLYDAPNYMELAFELSIVVHLRIFVCSLLHIGNMKTHTLSTMSILTCWNEQNKILYRPLSLFFDVHTMCPVCYLIAAESLRVLFIWKNGKKEWRIYRYLWALSANYAFFSSQSVDSVDFESVSWCASLRLNEALTKYLLFIVCGIRLK